METKWSKEAEAIFNKVIGNLPDFHRSIAKELVKTKSEIIAKEQNRDTVETSDVVTAFYQEVPPAFKEMMKRLFHQLGIEYKSLE